MPASSRCPSPADDWDADFDVDEWHGTNAFIRDDDKIYRTYFVESRGDEAMGSTWNDLDITAPGRQEEWEDSPDGYSQEAPYQWWHLHDEYEACGRRPVAQRDERAADPNEEKAASDAVDFGAALPVKVSALHGRNEST